jgi:hypothetical protein
MLPAVVLGLFRTCTSERPKILRAPHSGQGTEKSSGSREMSTLIEISVRQFLQVTAFDNAAGSEVSALRPNSFNGCLLVTAAIYRSRVRLVGEIPAADPTLIEMHHSALSGARGWQRELPWTHKNPDLPAPGRRAKKVTLARDADISPRFYWGLLQRKSGRHCGGALTEAQNFSQATSMVASELARQCHGRYCLNKRPRWHRSIRQGS